MLIVKTKMNNLYTLFLFAFIPLERFCEVDFFRKSCCCYIGLGKLELSGAFDNPVPLFFNASTFFQIRVRVSAELFLSGSFIPFYFFFYTSLCLFFSFASWAVPS